MENTKEKSLLAGDTFEEAGKKTMKNNGDHEEGVHAITQKVPLQTNTDHRSSMETNLNAFSSSIPNNQLEDLLKMAKAKMGEVREENERLKLLLAQMLKDYKSLQKNFLYMVKQEEANKKSTDTIFSSTPRRQSTDQEEPGLISLSLGRGSSTEPNKKDEEKNQNLNGGRLLSLGLDLNCRFDQLINSSTCTQPSDDDEKNKITSSSFHEDQLKEEEPIIETRPPPSKNIKNMRNGGGDREDEQVMEQTHLKKARVSVRARCETPTMNDGCQWRKYGQKTAKGNPCPRAYYRCTVSPNCPVRKQVQRWVEDMSILITTYEGNHNHSLPISATAMASTTSAAASMLQCRSSTSQGLADNGVLDTSVSTSAAANLHGLNFAAGNIYNASPHHQFYFPNNYSSISTSNSHPTITLDLTTAPTNYNSSSYLNRLISSSSTCNLNFSSPSSSSNYNSLNQPYNSSYMQMNNVLAPPPAPHHHHQSTIATATTKVITSNPNFQSVLAAAISSYIASKGAADDHQQNMIGISSSGDNNSGLNNLNKWVPAQVTTHESFPIMPAAAAYSTSSAQNRSNTGCASSSLNKLASSNNNSQQQEAGNNNMYEVPVPSLPFSTSKSSASGSP
ncbi:hypothetical protein Ddye_031113 [Dipteronia dyeriana]|uniref:WRKY domain-containing protein n=1 Tax=Dipteronia dyeriana TaxID=168575 RepID=A0AAD9TIC6_9ROSI|nr:hypothetical protein Ddye_031113 [Dipteronia dyeriana]